MNERRVSYCPPATKIIQQFVREVCQQLTEQGHTGYNTPDVISGLADYLIFTAQIIAKYLNEGHDELLDKDSKAE